VRERHRIPVPRVLTVLGIVGFLFSVPAYPSGFQVMTQGAKATGMGLAFAGVADDPSAIFYNPAGMAFQEHFAVQAGGAVLGRFPTDFTGANPYPGVGQNGSVDDTQQFLIPHLYMIVPLTTELNFGLGIDAPYGLGLRWDNPNTSWSGQFISQNAVIKALDINPVFSYKLFPELSIAAGADYRFSGLQLEQNIPAVNPFTGAVQAVGHSKLYSNLLDNGGWGWNVGIMWKPSPNFGLGGGYRSKITVNYEGTATITPRATGNPVFDALAAASLPLGEHPVATSIEFPASANIGAGLGLGAGLTLALEADWTQWSSFSSLDIIFPTGFAPDVHRITDWQDSWAYRVGLEKKFGDWALRVGYYYDNTPQPTKDAGPILADNDRNVYSFGFGYNTPQWGFDVGGLYIAFKEREVLTPPQTDNFFGTYSENAWAAVADLRISF
jgi:long-chain fatty acid transport protein